MPKDPIVTSPWTADAERRGRSGAVVPRWVFIAGVTTAVALALVLLRFAIDLLGLVLVFVLVGFSVRALGDWLSDDDSVSGSSLLAAALSLAATIAVGVWLFDVRQIDATGAIQRRLPSSVTRAIDWAEERGWGQRILLPDGSSRQPARPSAPAVTGRPAPSLAIEIPAPSPPSVAPPRPAAPAAGTAAPSTPGARPRAGGRASARREQPARSGGARQPAGLSSDPGSATRVPEPRGTGQGAAAASVPAPAPAVTRTLLTAWPAAAVVGTSVRLTATVESDAEPAPRGSVVFRLGDRVLGTARLRADGNASSGFIVVLDLPVGEHVIVADYAGDERHAPSRSAPVRQPVVRR
jgi:hypothetical protein